MVAKGDHPFVETSHRVTAVEAKLLTPVIIIIIIIIIILFLFLLLWGTAVAQWLRCCATIRKVAGSIPAGVIGFFVNIKSFWSHYGPGVDTGL